MTCSSLSIVSPLNSLSHSLPLPRCHSAAGVDVLFSNAALHWAPDIHASLFPHLLRQLRVGGVLAVQMPNTFSQPSHRCCIETLQEGSYLSAEQLQSLLSKQPAVHADGAAYYYHLLRPHARLVDVWQTEYMQTVSSPSEYHPVLEFTSSTFLAPILAALPSEEARDDFKRRYSAKLDQAYPLFDDAKQAGKKFALFPFRRIFIIAVR